jgi:hypothetical protein
LLLPTPSFSLGDITPLAQGETISIGWSIGDLGGTGLADGIAIDNIQITMSSTSVPEPGGVAVVCALLGAGLTWRRKRGARNTSPTRKSA